MDRAFIHCIYRVFFRQFWFGETYRFLFTAKLNFDLVFNTKLQVFINKLESFLVHNMTSLIKINMHQWYMCILTCLYIHCVNKFEFYIYNSSVIELNIFIKKDKRFEAEFLQDFYSLVNMKTLWVVTQRRFVLSNELSLLS